MNLNFWEAYQLDFRSADGIPSILCEGPEQFSEIINLLGKIPESKFVFRGQRRADWKLTPGLARFSPERIVKEDHAKEQIDLFRKSVRGFKMDRSLLEGNDSRAEKELWSTGQHCGLHTPLLDWTSAPFIALFFAFEQKDCAHKQKNPFRCVFALNKLKVESLWVANADDSIRFIEPIEDEQGRLVAQEGLFTISPYGKNFEETLLNGLASKLVQGEVISDPNVVAPYLLRILIVNRNQPEIIKFLRDMSINYAKMYPGLIGASQDCNSIFETKYVNQVTALDSIEETLQTINPPALARFPQELIPSLTQTIQLYWNHHASASSLAVANLIGAWDENNAVDIAAITELSGKTYDTLVYEYREILEHPESPLSFVSGHWQVKDRIDLLESLKSRLFEKDLTILMKIALKVFTEIDPAFELEPEQRFAASIYGKKTLYSNILRKGLAEGLAMLGSTKLDFPRCSQSSIHSAVKTSICEILDSTDWQLWGSLNSLLPTLAEAAPEVFLNQIEHALHVSPCPFDQLFTQEGIGALGHNYLTGLWWALENLAWDQTYLVHATQVLGELAAHDPGGNWVNRPINSLTTIFLPWRYQTLASIDKRTTAVQTLCVNWPNIGWKLLLNLLPNHFQTSSGTSKPVWLLRIPEDHGKTINNTEYWQQIENYSKIAIAQAKSDSKKLAELIDHSTDLPPEVFRQFVKRLSLDDLKELPDQERLFIWDHLLKLTVKHRKFPEAKWVMPVERLEALETISAGLAPVDPFILHQPLFTDRDFDLYEDTDDYAAQATKLDQRRQAAIQQIFNTKGFGSVVDFANQVISPSQVGHALGGISDESIDLQILPSFLDDGNAVHIALATGFIWKRLNIYGWEWCDTFAELKWSTKQITKFFCLLPFKTEAWSRAEKWLGADQSEYWTQTNANPYQHDGIPEYAIEKMLENGRPFAAINCLAVAHQFKHTISTNQVKRALLDACQSQEPVEALDRHNITETIKYLQDSPDVTDEERIAIEWAFLAMLDEYSGTRPRTLERQLANDPNLFCELIRLIFRSKNFQQEQELPDEQKKNTAINAYRLLDNWKTIPGMQESGVFDAQFFEEWFNQIRKSTAESGHLEIALSKVGVVLVHAPADPEGLWIHKAVAKALNGVEADSLRQGYQIGIMNSRGVHWVDPSGKPELDLAEEYDQKEKAILSQGYHKFAQTLRGIAENYREDADRIRRQYEGDDE